MNNLIKRTEVENAKLEDIGRRASGGAFNNAAQVWNHSFYWNCLSPKGGAPSGVLDATIDKKWCSFAAFKESFSKSAVGNFGSGWIWLVRKADNSLDIVNTGTHGAEKPLMICDVREHAYYIDYRNARHKSVESCWNLVHWVFVSKNYTGLCRAADGVRACRVKRSRSGCGHQRG